MAFASGQENAFNAIVKNRIIEAKKGHGRSAKRNQFGASAPPRYHFSRVIGFQCFRFWR